MVTGTKDREPTEEQKQWLWEQCGFEYNDDWSNTSPYKDPAGTILHNWKGIDLNNLFKYAVPKVTEGDDYTVHLAMSKYHTYAYITPHYEHLPSYKYDDNDPSLALFWVCFEALGGKRW